MTYGDIIRRLDFLYRLLCLDFSAEYCKNKPECDVLLDTEDGIPESNCIQCLAEYLKKEAIDVNYEKILENKSN